MSSKTFRAAVLMDALHLVYQEFGENARIIHTREVEEKRLWGLRRKTYFEITASPPEPKSDGTSESEHAEPADDSFLRQLRSSPYAAAPRASTAAPFVIPTQSPPVQSPPAEEPWKPVPTGLWHCMTPEQLNPTVLQRSLIAQFEKMLRFGGPIDLSEGKKKTVALIGPSGVGKTATLAKIAAHYRHKEFKHVGLITVDAYRVAAVEQLTKYAEMLDCPVETITEPFRIKTALARLANCNLVLIDTPGLNPKNSARLQFLAEMLQATALVDTALETHLILPATGSAAFLLDMNRRFESLSPTNLTVTKLDEAVGPSDLYRFLKELSIPLRFFTTGQNMNEDIEVAGPARLAENV